MRAFFSYFLSQVPVQILSFVTGLLLIRYMDKSEYGWYTLASSAIIMMVMFTDLGVGSGISALGGRYYENRKRLSQIFSAAHIQRKKLMILSSLLGYPYLVYVLIENKMPLSGIVMISILGLLTQIAQIQSQIFRGVFTILLKTKWVITEDIITALARCVLIVGLIPFWLKVESVLIVQLVVLCGVLFLQCRWGKSVVDNNEQARSEDVNFFRLLIYRQGPSTIYYSLAGQLNFLLLTIFGTIGKVAELGALTKLFVILRGLEQAMAVIIAPRFSRCLDRRKLLIFLGGVVAALIVFSICFIGGVFMFNHFILRILGPEYTQMEDALNWMALSVCISFSNMSISKMNKAKGWIIPPIPFIGVQIIFYAVMICFLDLSLLVSVILLTIFNQGLVLSINILWSLRKIHEFDSCEKITG